jgi:hypothetical protein
MKLLPEEKVLVVAPLTLTTHRLMLETHLQLRMIPLDQVAFCYFEAEERSLWRLFFVLLVGAALVVGFGAGISDQWQYYSPLLIVFGALIEAALITWYTHSGSVSIRVVSAGGDISVSGRGADREAWLAFIDQVHFARAMAVKNN